MKRVALGRWISAIALCAHARWALAQSSSTEPASTQLAAEVLFIDGVKLMKDDHCAEAIVKFKESQRLDPASGTLLNLAYCEVRLGRPASAWLTYRQALALAQATQKPRHAQIAQEQSDRLEAELPRLVVSAAGNRPRELIVELDGAALTRPIWSLPMPLDPGKHTLSAKLEDGGVWQKTFDIAAAERVLVDIPLPATPIAAANPAAAQSSQTSPARTRAMTALAEAPPRAAQTESPRGPLWTLGVAATGAAALTAGVALFVSARVSYDNARAHCGSANTCLDEYYDAEHDAIGRMRLSLVLAGTGAVLGGLGSWLYWAPPGKAGARVSAFIGPASAGIRGKF